MCYKPSVELIIFCYYHVITVLVSLDWSGLSLYSPKVRQDPHWQSRQDRHPQQVVSRQRPISSLTRLQAVSLTSQWELTVKDQVDSRRNCLTLANNATQFHSRVLLYLFIHIHDSSKVNGIVDIKFYLLMSNKEQCLFSLSVIPFNNILPQCKPLPDR